MAFKNLTPIYHAIERSAILRTRYDTDIMRGGSFQLQNTTNIQEKVAQIRSIPGMDTIWPVRTYRMPMPQVEWIYQESEQEPHLFSRALGNQTNLPVSSHVMTQVDKLHAKGFTGKGIKVAVIDSGIDYKHPALGGCFGPGCLVSFGADLTGDQYEFQSPVHKPQPDADPMDCQGHGTHVAGIIAAQPNPLGFTGAAPGVTLGAYRVTDCVGGGDNDIILRGIQQAYLDGANIISVSIGDPGGWSSSPLSLAVSRIVEKGVQCVFAAGNDGDAGLFHADWPGTSEAAISVANFQNTHWPMLRFPARYSIDGAPAVDFTFAPSFKHLSVSPWTNTTTNVYGLTSNAGACEPLPNHTPDLSQHVVLARTGSCSTQTQIDNLKNRNVKRILFSHDLENGMPVPPKNNPYGPYIAILSSELGETWFDALRAGQKVTFETGDLATKLPEMHSMRDTKQGGAVSDTSSWGPTWEMNVKPDIGATGFNIFSTYLREKGGYAVLSGTSMAAPLAASVMALVSEVRGTSDQALIKKVLTVTSKPQSFHDGNGFLAQPAPVPQQGGGLVQAYDAAFAATLLEPCKLSFNDSKNTPTSLDFRITNTGSESVTYNLSYNPAMTMYTLPYDGPGWKPHDHAVETSAIIKLGQSSVIVAPGQSVNVSVAAVPPGDLDASRLPLWSGYITVNGTDNSALSIPYQGLAASLCDMRLLDPESVSLRRAFGSGDGRKEDPVHENATFTFPGPTSSGFPDGELLLSVRVNLATSLVRFDIVPLATSNNTRRVLGLETLGQPRTAPLRWLQRSLKPFTMTWDGSLVDEIDTPLNSYAPEGQYKIVVRALRIFGDSNNETDYDVVASPLFRIQYSASNH
ncbi:hypothetical protein HIM_06806 [Hirsutella minnesotensis 3608]|uniref:Peptidase S8/S53 domain-containing protein n=1 Tax=Hirsutella minnesotensis 3608 TaxID=1043627 RepID=A0A0F7ZTT8_9HYPO|nr:hypothetical protein HIM_06806 [Hirsutella minnesotensis 3608]